MTDTNGGVAGDHPNVTVRPAISVDLGHINQIYNHYILNTAITFDVVPWHMVKRRSWFHKFSPSGRYRLVVAENGAGVVGFAYSSVFREKAAYDTTVEMTVYCAPDATGRGIGSAMYATLFDQLKGEDIRLAVAAITLPNEASIRLHERFGFTQVGVMRDVGRKFGMFWAVAWYERLIETRAEDPSRAASSGASHLPARKGGQRALHGRRNVHEGVSR